MEQNYISSLAWIFHVTFQKMNHEENNIFCFPYRDDNILNILAEMFYLSCIYAHVGHKRRALSVVVDVVIIRHGARQEGGVHCLLCAACPMTE